MSRRAAAPTMPHIGSAFHLGRFPGRDRPLGAARQRQLARRRVLGDGRARADIGAARDAHWSDQRRIGADEAIIFDHGAVLGNTVVIAGDGASAHIDACAELRIADVAKVIGLRLRAQPTGLDLDEVADMHVLGEAGSRAQPGVGSYPAALADLGFLQVREGKHLAARTDAHIAQHAIRADAHAFAKAHAPFEDAVDVDRYIALAIELAAHVEARRIGEADAGVHQPARLLRLEGALERRELGLGIDAGDFHRVIHLDRSHAHAFLDRQRDDVGEVILLLRVAVADLADPSIEEPGIERHESGIDLPDRALRARGVLLLRDALYAAARVAHDASVTLRVAHFRRHDGEPVARRVYQLSETLGAH